MNELLQTTIPVITAFLGAGLTYLAQSRLINKQLTLNKKQIRFEKSRDSLGKLKSLHLSIMIILTDLDIETKSFEKNKIDIETYESRCNYARETLTGIISEAFKLYTQQLDFEIVGLLDFYLEIDAFITRSLFKKPYTSTEKDNIFPTYYSYDFSMKTADKLLSKIEKTAKLLND